ncbi:aminotransferase class V-fold PLP-dependent enzyme [Weissella confusa]|uniref:aminotransferase class V-fold PLP-dependent enzyme n=1 Tax=Weissella confusa TaxID=1583 RepID=UPI0015F4179D|nr:aminotransferase class V-fold PLP-dependent enzyme [Weissella confusa]MBA5934512.1 aminotransferase class V-fold PLP-dependent enzyme [Weissella confusa]
MIYFDNASTSFPKPVEVIQGVQSLMENSSGNAMRTTSTEKTDIVFETRKKIAKPFNVKFPTSIVFTSNSTESLNTIIEGYLKPGDHVVSSAIEHNSVVRPLVRLHKERNIALSWVPVNEFGLINPNDVIEAITEKTTLVIINHASNVTGTIQDVESIGEQLQAYPDVKFLIDASQTAGHIPIDNQRIKADFIAFTGHKALLGISGVGGYYINPEIKIRPLKVGGTGVLSELLVQPEGMPLHYESGTLNTIGIGALFYGINYIDKFGIENISKELIEKTAQVIERLGSFSEVKIYSQKNASGIVSFNIDGIIPSRLSTFLSEDANISTRSGLMCAPFIHEFINTNPFGCVRISMSHFTTQKEIDTFVDYIAKVIHNLPEIRNINIPKVYSNPSIYDFNEEGA